jgi:hypothetical protein
MAREHCVMSDFLTVGFSLANSSFYCSNLHLCMRFIFVCPFKTWSLTVRNVLPISHFYVAQQPIAGPGLPLCWSFEITYTLTHIHARTHRRAPTHTRAPTPTHTTHNRTHTHTPVRSSVRHRGRYLQNTQQTKREIFMHPAESNPRSQHVRGCRLP